MSVTLSGEGAGCCIDGQWSSAAVEKTLVDVDLTLDITCSVPNLGVMTDVEFICSDWLTIIAGFRAGIIGQANVTFDLHGELVHPVAAVCDEVCSGLTALSGGVSGTLDGSLQFGGELGIQVGVGKVDIEVYAPSPFVSMALGVEGGVKAASECEFEWCGQAYYGPLAAGIRLNVLGLPWGPWQKEVVRRHSFGDGCSS